MRPLAFFTASATSRCVRRRQRARLRGRAVDEDAVAAARDLAFDQVAIGVEIDLRRP